MVEQSQHVQRIARSGGLNVVGALVGAVTGFGVTAALTNWLAPDVAGTIFATTSLFLIATAVTQIGTESGMVRWLPAKLATGREQDVRAVLAVGLLPVVLVSSVVAAVLVLAAPAVAELVVGGAHVDAVADQVRVLALFLPVAATFNVVLAATRGLRTMRPTILLESIGRSLLQLLVVVGVISLGASSPVVVLAWAGPYALALVLAGLWLGLLLRRVTRRGAARAADPEVEASPAAAPEAGGSVAGQFWRYTAPRAVSTMAQTLLKRSDVVLVAALRSPAEAALYAAASRFVTLGQVGVQALQQALGPQLSAMFASQQHDEALEVYRLTTAWSIMMAWPVYIASAVLAPTLMLVFGNGYSEGATVVVVLSAAMLVAVASGSVDTVMLMSGRSLLSLANVLVTLVVNVALNLLLIPPLGIEGAAIAWAVAIVVRNVLPLVQVRSALGMTPASPATWLVGSAALGCFAVVPGTLALLGVSAVWVFAALVLGGLVYVAVLVRAREMLELSALVRALRRGRRGGPRGMRSPSVQD